MTPTKIFPVSRKRDLYERLRRASALKKFPVTESFLRQDLVIKNNQTTYAFDFHQNNRAAERPQVLLSDKDVFVVSAMALCLAKVNPAKPQTAILHSYPNKQHFTVGSTVAADLEAFYNAELSAQIDSTVVFDPLSTLRFRHVPGNIELPIEAGGAQAVPVSSYAGVPGLQDIEPGLVMNGQRSQKFTLELQRFETGTPAWESGDADNVIKAVLYLDGYKITSAAESHYQDVLNVLMQ